MTAVLILRLVVWYVLIATAAFAFHLLAGVISVGTDEVIRQTREAYQELGAVRMAAFILTAGIYKGGVEP